MDFEELRRIVTDYTLLDATRLHSLWSLAADVSHRGVKGDIVECGSYKGGSAAILRAAMGCQRKLWIFDSFQGMPNIGKEDSEDAGNFVGECVGSERDVTYILGATGAANEEYVIRAGWFDDTFRSSLPEQVALLHCYADWYDSVILVLETFYGLIPDGGCVILDDFGYWEGCRKAFYDFCKKHNERPLLERVGANQAYWIKGKEHNRNG